MANINKNFASLVAIGSQNPQILNEDFLKINGIIPADRPPFERKTKFISTPPFATIEFGPVSIIVEEQRFQIREVDLSDWKHSHVFNIATKYYEILKYTPIKTAGINLNSQIDFDSIEESEKFQNLLMPKTAKVIEIISKEDVDVSLRLRYPHLHNGRVLLTIEGVTLDKLHRQLNFNYEFECLEDNQTNWPKFKAELNNLNQLIKYFNSVLERFQEAIS